MSVPKHPFIDPDDTDWGQQQRRLHEENRERLTRLESGQQALWLKIDEADRKRDEARAEINARWERLDALWDDLRQAITLFRGAKITAGVVAWVAGIGTAATAIWQFFWPKK
jgi:chromosome segregation ATPase